ncbi:hypothetical protein AAKU55_005783 [Oxalobacteraceae bacterium GrIS 1.11]
MAHSRPHRQSRPHGIHRIGCTTHALDSMTALVVQRQTDQAIDEAIDQATTMAHRLTDAERGAVGEQSWQAISAIASGTGNASHYGHLMRMAHVGAVLAERSEKGRGQEHLPAFYKAIGSLLGMCERLMEDGTLFFDKAGLANVGAMARLYDDQLKRVTQGEIAASFGELLRRMEVIVAQSKDEPGTGQ